MAIATRIEAWTLPQKVVALVIAVIVCLSVTLCLNVGLALDRYAEQICIDRQQANMRVGWEVLHSYGTDFHVADGKLYVGSHLLNGDFDSVDKIQTLVGGAATIFLGDERIATNVKKPDGSRAVGSKLAPGPAHDQVLVRALPYHGEATILGEPYLAAYEPIRDAAGAVIGALFVGVPKSDFFAGIRSLLLTCALVTLLVTAAAVAASVFFARRMFQPLDVLRRSAERLAEGDFSMEIGFTQRRDDIGQLAKVLRKHQETSRAKARTEAENTRIEAARLELEAANTRAQQERDARERRELKERVAAATEQQCTVEILGTGLDQLSAGKLRHRIESVFPAQYEKLRCDFNIAMQSLAETMAAIAGGAHTVQTGTESIRADISKLSDRTRQQASRLATTTEALGRVTRGIEETARAAATTRVTVDAARDAAQTSALVVRQAIEAMSTIEDSSKQIQQIIGVIDDIAFQTNLLALNAAVEAARAGDQGLGFAVVAAEVRNLASRSSDAAKQIKTLILRSSEQVGNGTALVGATGKALERIATQVDEINSMVREIDSNAIAQSGEIRAVEGALTELDALTRQNNSMVEASTEATEALSQSALDLTGRLQRFDLDGVHATETDQTRRRRASR